MKRAVLHLRVSTIEQTTANQERQLEAIAGRMGLEIVKVYKDQGLAVPRALKSGRRSMLCAGTRLSANSTW
jgi:DNA invertase Pin-like site-specific DNA recombinase